MYVHSNQEGENNHGYHMVRRGCVRLLRGGASLVAAAAGLIGAQQAQAQAATNLVSACSGVSLPRSAVTGIIGPVIEGVVNPIQTRVNPLLGILTPLSIDTTTLLANAAAGQPITLQALNRSGNVVGPADRCDVQGDSFGLNTEGGVAIGGNRITGLGTNGLDASAGEAGSIAFGNSATTDPSATNAIAFGSGATVGVGAIGGTALGTGASVTAANGVAVGNGSLAARGALAGYTAPGLGTPQTSAGEFSVGAIGAERQITNVAAGSAPTDAVNVAQLNGVAAQIMTGTANSVLYDTATHDRVTLGGAAGTTLTNVAPGAIDPRSTDAVNGSQLFATNSNVTDLTNSVTTLTNNVTSLAGDVTNLTGSVTNLTTAVQNGAAGPVRYSDAATPTTPNGGTPTDELTLVGATAGSVGLHNVRAGSLGAGSTDAVNGGQIAALGGSIAGAIGGSTTYNPETNSVTAVLRYGGNVFGSVQEAISAVGNATTAGGGSQYFSVQSTLPGALVTADDSVAIGPQATASAANSVALGTGATADRGGVAAYAATGLTAPQTSAGEVAVGAAGAERQITHVAAGSAPTDAANIGQLQGVAGQAAAAQGTANTALALGQNSIQYDGAARNNVTLGGSGSGTPVALHNIAAGVSASDAVNLGQLNAGMAGAVTQANAYTDTRLLAVSYDLRRLRRDGRAGAAGALAAAGLPQPYEAGKGMIAFGAGTYQGQQAIAFGLSKAMSDGHTVVKVAGTYDTRGKAGANAGVGYQF
jgi:autotransporter adhesin